MSNIQRQVLANGLTILGEPKSSAQSMAAGYFVRTGSRDESPDIAGVSHFLEHMMFKGSEHRSADDVNREFDEIGAHYNAFTSEENTVYYGAVLPEFQSRLLDLLTDLLRPALRDEDFDVEKNVILEEIALYNDQPQHVAFDMLRRLFFSDHPLGNSVLGTNRSIQGLKAEQMRSYFGKRYSPNNMILALTGNYDWNAVLSQVEPLCIDWLPQEAGRSIAQAGTSPCIHVVSDSGLARAHIAVGFQGISAQDPRRRAADILSDVLGGARGSRLYWALVEPGLADVAQMFHEEADGAGWFGAYISCDPDRSQEVCDRLMDVITEAATANIRPDEVARLTRKAAAGHVLASETPMGRLTSVGFDWIYRQQVESVDQEADALLAVTADDCNALLAEHLLDTTVTVVMGPVRSRIEALQSYPPSQSVEPTALS